MRCATRISRSPLNSAACSPGSACFGVSTLRAVGAIHGVQVGSFNLTAGVSEGLQCTLSTSSFFPVDCRDSGACAPPLPAEPAELDVPGVVPPPKMSTGGNVYTLHVVGPTAFIAEAAEVLGDDVLVDVTGKYHVEPYTFWRSGKYECPTVRLTYDRLRSTADSLRILRAPDNTVARQRRLYRAIFMGKNV
ncbi:hypothetical protein, conserved [Leishmania lindenbergi]|uniref:Uncharacterized protein n=1 Tax=Leishmania lindenbergi TaxID=651832 RepID=A0AAW3AXF2_9TRYP